MSSYMQSEILLLLRSVIMGMLLAGSYDIFICLRKVLWHQTIWISFEDILFWICVGIVVFCHIYHDNDGEPRSYLFIGYLLGSWLYHVSLRKLVLKVMEILLSIPVVFGKKVINVLLFPIKRGKIFVCNFGKFVVFWGKHRDFRLKRGNWVEKIKTKGKEK